MMGFGRHAFSALCLLTFATSTVACGSGQERQHTEPAPTRASRPENAEEAVIDPGPAPDVRVPASVGSEGVSLRIENHDKSTVYVAEVLALQRESDGHFSNTQAKLTTRSSCASTSAQACRPLVPGAVLVPARIRPSITGDTQCSDDKQITVGTFRATVTLCDASGQPSGHVITSDAFTITAD